MQGRRRSNGFESVEENVEMMIFDVSGKVVFSKSIAKLAPDESIIVPVHAFSSGLYLVSLNSVHGKSIARFAVAH